MNIVSEVNLTSAVPVKTQPGKIQSERVIELSLILNVVCWFDNVNVSDVKGEKQFKELRTARQDYCYIACKLTQQRWNPYGNTLRIIGKEINRDHATVLYHKNKIEGWLEIPAYNLREKLELIEGRLRF